LISFHSAYRKEAYIIFFLFKLFHLGKEFQKHPLINFCFSYSLLPNNFSEGTVKKIGKGET